MTTEAIDQLPAVRHALAAVDDLDVFAQAFHVSSPVNYADGAEYLKGVKQAAATLEATRRGITDPLNASIKKVNDFFRKPAERLAGIERIIKSKLLAYSQEQERIRMEQQRKLDAEAAAERQRLNDIAMRAAAKGQEDKAEQFSARAQQLVAPVAQIETPKVLGLSTREQWCFEILDARKVPDLYKMVDEKKIGALVRSMKGDAQALLGDGVRVYKEQIIASGKLTA